MSALLSMVLAKMWCMKSVVVASTRSAVGEDGVYIGVGTYFTTNSSEADIYTDPFGSGTCLSRAAEPQMIFARVSKLRSNF